MEDRRVRLQSSDGEFFRVTVPVARISRTIATLLDGLCVYILKLCKAKASHEPSCVLCFCAELGCEEGDVIPLPNVNSRILKKVILMKVYYLWN